MNRKRSVQFFSEWIAIISAKEVMFTPVSVCLSDCLSMSKITQKVHIWIKILDNMGVKTRNRSLNFGGAA